MIIKKAKQKWVTPRKVWKARSIDGIVNDINRTFYKEKL